MAYYLNDQIDATFTVLDNADDPVTGLTSGDFATIEAYRLPSGAVTAVVTITEINEGQYVASFTPTAVGTWNVHVTYDSGTYQRNFAADFSVEQRASASSTVVASGGLTTTLIQLIADVAAELGDFIEMTATDDASNVTLKDTRRIVQANNAYAGREAYFVSGTADNVGEWRIVTGSDGSAHTINFGDTLPADTTAGDVVYLFNERGRGFSRNEYKAAINRSVRFARGHALIDQMQEQADLFDRDSPEIAVDASFLYISSVEYEYDTDIWYELRRASSPTDEGWFLLPGRLLRLQGDTPAVADGYTLRLIGQGAPAELANDDDTTTVDAEWIVLQAASYLDRGGIDRSKNRERERTMQYRQNLANGLLPLITALPRINAVRVT